MLNANGIWKSFDTQGGVGVLEDVSLAITRGESVAVMGPSGSGKSTLLYVLGALEPPTRGTVTLDDVDPYSLSESDQARFRAVNVGFVFQDHLLLPQLSALDNVLAPTVVAGARGGGADAVGRARWLLTEVGLADRMSHRPAELSGGERQRVAVARALVNQPALVLCDEPTGNLDRASAESVADLLLTLHRAHRTILVVVTHSTAMAGRFERRYSLVDRRLEVMP